VLAIQWTGLTPLGSSRREQVSFKIDHSESSQEEEVMQEEETFSSPAGNTRSRRSSKSSAREFSRNKADITRGKKPVGRRLELVDEDFEEEMASPEEDDQTEKGRDDDLELEKCATRNKFYKLLKCNEFLGTRYPHPDTMERLGIYDDVDYMFKQCSLNIHMFRPMEGYEEETIQFLSSVELLLYGESEDDEIRPDGSLGYLEFCVYDVEYRLPIEHLELMYGFPSGKDTSHRFDKKELQSFWATLGSKHVFSSFRTKSNEIRSPVVRYFHRSLASALFARERNGTFVNRELELMEIVLQELLGLASDGTVLAGDQTDTSVSFYLIEHLLSYRGWAKGLKKPGKRVVGGVVTPILRACNVPLHSTLIPPRWIVMQHLINSKSFWSQQNHGLYK